MATLFLSRLLQDLPPARFLQENWLREPLWRTGTAGELVDLATWERVDELVDHTQCDVLCVKDGQAHPGGRPANAAAARALFAQGYSLALRQPDQFDRELAALGRTFVGELFGTLNLHVYCTPAGHGSFGWHCDPEEVFIIQTRGRKRYSLRENTVNPNPLEEAMATAADMKREQSEVIEVELGPGDCLYIPGGWWHTTRAIDESISLSVGILPPTPVALLDMLRAELLASPAGRRRLPPMGRANEAPEPEKVEACRAELRAVAEDLRRKAEDPMTTVRFLAAYGMAGMTGRR